MVANKSILKCKTTKKRMFRQTKNNKPSTISIYNRYMKTRIIISTQAYILTKINIPPLNSFNTSQT